ncbi:MAG: hypothetical protein WA945_06035 [Arcobacteraceae bacterium]
MTYFLKILLVLPLLIFTACSSKSQVNINQEMNTFSLHEKVVIFKAAKNVPSPFSIGLGLGGIANHIGLGVSTAFRPDMTNDEGLDLGSSVAVHEVSLEDIVKNEFSQQMKNDEYYKNKYVSSQAKYTVYLFIPKFIIDKSLFTSDATLKVYIALEILNKNNDVVYSDTVVNESFSEKEDSLLNNKVILEKALQDSVEKSISELIVNMKKSDQ